MSASRRRDGVDSGFAYILASLATLSFSLWLALSRPGRLRLGDAESKANHSTASWAAMLLSAGIGSVILHFGTIEWIYHDLDAPFSLDPRTPAAIRWATVYGLFRWGPAGWAFYCLPAVALGYSYHVRGEDSLRLSSACRSRSLRRDVHRPDLSRPNDP